MSDSVPLDDSAARVLCVGEALIDVVRPAPGVPGEVAEHVGGSILNVATGLARLGHDTVLATWIGDDARGRRIAATAEQAGVKVLAGSASAQRTPVAQALVDADGKASYEFDLEWQVPGLGGLDHHVGHLHTGSFAATLEPGAGDVLAAVQGFRPTASISYDPNIRPALMGSADLVRDRIEQIVALSDVVKASDEDLAWLHPDLSVEQVLELWCTMGPQLVVVTRGAEGATARISHSGELVVAEPHRVDVGDTVGAGDSFMAGMVSALLDAGLIGSRDAVPQFQVVTPEQVQAALQRAIETSAITVSHVGAYSPTRDELG